MAEFADLFPNAELAVQPGAGQYPWLDHADRFVVTTQISWDRPPPRRHNPSRERPPAATARHNGK